MCRPHLDTAVLTFAQLTIADSLIQGFRPLLENTVVQECSDYMRQGETGSTNIAREPPAQGARHAVVG